MMRTISVFETILASTNSDTALEAVHNVLRVLRHRRHSGRYVRDLRTQPANDVDETTARIIEAIEMREQLPIDQLDDSRAERYIVDLAKVAVERTTRNTAHLRSTARTVLEGLRQDLDA
jgi:hypothetical protein